MTTSITLPKGTIVGADDAIFILIEDSIFLNMDIKDNNLSESDVGIDKDMRLRYFDRDNIQSKLALPGPAPELYGLTGDDYMDEVALHVDQVYQGPHFIYKMYIYQDKNMIQGYHSRPDLNMDKMPSMRLSVISLWTGDKICKSSRISFMTYSSTHYTNIKIVYKNE